MNIGIIGAGRIGGTLARHFAVAGHDVAISNSRGPDMLSGLAAELGERVRAMTVDEAAGFGDLVVVAVPFKAYLDIPPEPVGGEVVIDAMNYYPGRDGHFAELDSDRTTSSEMLAQHLAGAYVVKAFNTIRWDILRDQAQPAATGGHIGIPIAGDDTAAKQDVDDLIAEIGFDGVDAGPLGAGGRKLQPGTEVFGAALPSAELAAKVAV
jgi:predicted dinucleotide-binding enzyme